MAVFAHLTGYVNAPRYVVHTLLALCKIVFILQILFSPGCKVWKFKCLDPPDLPLPDNIPLNYLKDGEEIGTEGATLRQDKMTISCA